MLGIKNYGRKTQAKSLTEGPTWICGKCNKRNVYEADECGDCKKGGICFSGNLFQRDCQVCKKHKHISKFKVKLKSKLRACDECISEMRKCKEKSVEAL